MHLAERVWTPGDDHDDHRSPRLQKLRDEVRLHTGQSEVLCIAALAGGTESEQAGEVAHECHAQVRITSRGHRCREAGRVGSLHRTPALVDYLEVRELGPQCVDPRLHVHTEAAAWVAGQHMVGECVAAHEGPRVVRARADNGDPAKSRPTFAK